MTLRYLKRSRQASAADTFGFARTPQGTRSASARLYSQNSMTIRVDSVEYKCWHEVGHATVCLHLGGDVNFIEFLNGDARGHARARCIVTSEIERTVACGGFAAEVYLLGNGYAERGRDDESDISRIVFHNAPVTARISGTASSVGTKHLQRRKTGSL